MIPQPKYEGEIRCVCPTEGIPHRDPRPCPLHDLIDTEAANEVPPRRDFDYPKGMKPMKQYHHSSSALTGRAPRSVSAAFGCSMRDPVHPMPDASRTSLSDWFAAIGQVFARLFGR